jgi:glutathione S-transferase
MTDLIHYYTVPSRGMVTHWMLEEIGVPFENRLLDFNKNEQKTPEYLAINPMGRVPALVHGDVVVTETAAIVAYLADAFPAANLSVAPDSADRGSFLRWLFFGPLTVETAVLWKALGEVKSEVDYKPFAEVEEVAATLAEAVRGKEFIVADRFTAADVIIGSNIMWGTQLMPVLPPLPELIEYWDRLSQRPAFLRANGKDQKLMGA